MKIQRLILLMVFIGCEEPFEFSTDEASTNFITIVGTIDDSDGPYVVYVRQTSQSGQATSIVGAEVVLVDESNNRMTLDGVGDGRYEGMAGAVKGSPGESYFVEVTLPSGEQFVSERDTVPEAGASLEISWREYLKEFTSDLGGDFTVPVVGISLETILEDPANQIFLYWLGEETYQFVPTDFPDPFGHIPPPCYVIQDFGTEQINLFSNAGYTDGSVAIEEVFYREIDDTFVRKHIFSIYQYSISEAYYNYLKSLESLVENTGSLFDNPPGRAIGNINTVSGESGRVLGFFAAARREYLRIAIYPSELRTFIYEECLYRPTMFRPEYDELCIDCLLIPRSSWDRPDYWVQY